MLVLLIVGAIAFSVFNWENSMAATIYPGVRIAGVDIGGRSLDAARRQLVPLRHAALDRTITVIAGSHRWTMTPQQLGLRLNLDDRLRVAYSLGREPSWLDRYGTQLDLVLHGRSLSLIGNYDSDVLHAFVQQVALAVFQPAQSAVVGLQGARALLTTQAQDGQRLDQAAATALLAAALADPHQSEVTVPVDDTPAPVSETEGRREVAALANILTAQLHLHFGSRHWLLGAGVIGPAISLTTVVASGGASTYQHSVDQEAISRFVAGLAGQIDQPVRTAQVVIHGSAISVLSAHAGYHLDQFTARQVLTQDILQGGRQDITLPVSAASPSTPTAVAQQTARQVAELIHYPLALTFGGRHWLLGSAQLASLLTFTPRQDPTAGPQLDLHVDPALLSAALAPMISDVAVAPRNARFAVQAAHLTIVPDTSGRRIDYASLAAAIQARGRSLAVPIPIQSYGASLTTAKLQSMGIGDLIIQHTTYFPGSSANRLTNIDAAVRHLDGQLIAPGEIFSFDTRIGPITPAGGYVQGINIVDNQDVPGIGGGVCQVAVTLFQAAVYSGLKIIERSPHANIVPYYDPIGMDATIYISPNGPDLKFQNNTGHWILINFSEDLQHYRLTARFFGADPHFRVVVRGPTVKHQPNGDVDAVFYRTVYDHTGKVLLNAHFNSHYVPVGART